MTIFLKKFLVEDSYIVHILQGVVGEAHYDGYWCYLKDDEYID